MRTTERDPTGEADWTDRFEAWAGIDIAVIFAALGVLSAITLFASLVLIPVLVSRMPTDYFRDPRRSPILWATRRPFVRWALLVGKNLAGAVLLVGGVLMLLLPGQGLLTILMGLVLINYPGKRRLERYLVTRPPILRGVNWLRHRAGRPPLEL